MEELLKVSLVILCFQLSSVNSQQAETPRAQIIQEGENASVSCSYKSMNTNLQWYRQDSRGSLALLLLMRSNEREKYRGRLKATLDASTKTSSLFISAAQLVDAATYFCATDTQHAAGTCSLTKTPPALPPGSPGSWCSGCLPF